VRGGTFDGVTFNVQAPAATDTLALPETDISKLEFPMTSPRPISGRSQFGVSTGTNDRDQPVINAHPESEIVFAPPPGATRILAEVGLIDAAFRPGAPSVTDGVTVEILENRPDGLRRLLYQRTLDPVKNERDRGPQAIVLDPAGPFSGPLVFKITAGPKGSLANDWAYWSRIEIR
jgi:hypothetical protein